MDHGVLGPVGPRGTVALRSPSHLVLAKDGLRDPGAEPEFTSHGDTEPTEQILKPTRSPYTILILERGVLGLGGGEEDFLQREQGFSLLFYHSQLTLLNLGHKTRRL